MFFSWGGANPLSVQALERVSAEMPIQELRDLDYGLKPQSSGLFLLDAFQTYSEREWPLQDTWGLHYGHPFYQRLGISLFEKNEARKWTWGISYDYRRQGWEQKDFAWVRNEGPLAQGYSMHLGGLWLKSPLERFLVGAGVAQVSNLVVSSNYPLSYWAKAEYEQMSVVALAHQNTLDWVRLGLELESRQVRGGQVSGWTLYLPRLNLEIRDPFNQKKNSSYLGKYSAIWEQNLYDQSLYTTVNAPLDSLKQSRVHLDWNIDYSRFFVIDVQASPLQKDYNVGFGLTAGLFKLMYNDEQMNERLGSQKSWSFVWSVALSAFQQEFWYSPGAARANPFEMSVKKKGQK